MRLTTIYLDCTTNHIELRENVLIAVVFGTSPVVT